MKRIIIVLVSLVNLLTATTCTFGQHANVTSVAIIDQELPYMEILLKGMKPGTRIAYIDKSQDPLKAIDAIIRANAPVSTLHIITHGKSGALLFPSTELNVHTMEQNEKMLGSWKQFFSHHGDIILYGSEIGKGGSGLHFVTSLAVLTGLDVAASKDKTGSTVKNGDWLLELRSGLIESTLVISKKTIAEYPALLSGVIEKKFMGIFTNL